MKRRPGVVLVLALLCIIAIEVTAVAMHFTTVQELGTARAAWRELELRTAAKSAAESIIAAWPAATAQSLSPRQTGVVPVSNPVIAPEITVSAEIERLSAAVFLIRAEARSARGDVARIGAMVQLAEPSDVAAAIDAAVTTSGDVHVGMGSGITVASRQCDTAATALPGGVARAVRIQGTGQLFMEGGTVEGDTARDSVSSSLNIATMRVDRLFDRARGSRDSLPFIEIIQGSDQPSHRSGILLIDGDATLDGLAFDGIIIVRGSLTLANGTLRGAVLVDGGPTHLENSTIRFDACSVRAAVATPLLLGPYRPHSRMWIPLY